MELPDDCPLIITKLPTGWLELSANALWAESQFDSKWTKDALFKKVYFWYFNPCASIGTTRRVKKLKRERGLSFDEALLVFSDGAHLMVVKNDDPEQFAAVGFADGHLITLIHEYREDEDGDVTWLVTYWKATKAEVKEYEKARR